MTLRIGIWGFGQIARALYRQLLFNPDVTVACIADPNPCSTAAYLLRYDSALGRLNKNVHNSEHALSCGSQNTAWCTATTPDQVPWQQHDVDLLIVTQANHHHTKFYEIAAEQLKHLWLLLDDQCPELPLSTTSVQLGITAASTLKNKKWWSTGDVASSSILLPLTHLQQTFGLQSLTYTCIRAYNENVRLADVPGTSLRSSRSATNNIIPTTALVPTCLQQALGPTTPIQAMNLHVPLLNGSAIDLTLTTAKTVNRESINASLTAAAVAHPSCLEASVDPIVSSDVLGSHHLALLDTQATMVQGEQLVKILIFFDNITGYAHQVAQICNDFHYLRS